jgi:hypothetical protein
VINLGTVYGNGQTYNTLEYAGIFVSNGTYSLVFNNIGHFVEVSQPINNAPPFPSYGPVLHAGTKTINFGSSATKIIPGEDVSFTGGVFSVTGINDFDTVVGYYIGNNSPLPLFSWGFGFYPEIYPFLYVNGQTYSRSNPLNVQPLPPTPSIYIYQYFGVNDAGQILAIGSVQDGGFTTSFILTPVSR